MAVGERNQWYLDYLKTPHWRETRARKVKAAGYCCERCFQPGRRTRRGTIAGLNVHHLNYDRVGNERDDDLEVLCGFCHQVEHGLVEDTGWNRERWRIRLTDRIAGSQAYADEDDIDLEMAAWDSLPDGQVA